MQTNKTFRLFVSSTFSDFAKERAVLQKNVFPEIKKYCANKGYTFQPIDLRWGVSNEAQLDQKTIELCLNEVRVCKTHPHPNFLIMAGDRYGRIPLPYMIESSEFNALLELMSEDEKNKILTWYQLDLNQLPASYILKKRTGKYEQRQEWIKIGNSLREILQTKVTQAFQDGKITENQKHKYFMSATETEVEEGIFNYLEPTEFQRNLSKEREDLPSLDRDNIFGFFRNINKESILGNNFVGKDYDDALMFKNKVKKVLLPENVLDISTNQKSEDTLVESYLEELEERLTSFLKTKVNSHIENEKQYSDKEVKRQAQEYFLKEKINNFMDREDVLDNIANYISNDDTRPLVIYGTSGIGKSSIIAKAILLSRQNQKDRKIASRFVGATTDTSSTTEVLIGIFDDLGIDIRNEKNKEVDEIMQIDNKPETFEEFSYRVYDQIMSLKDQVIIFIDAVDQFSNTDQFLWLPKNLPENVKVIISALEDNKYEEDTKYFQVLKNKTENILLIPMFEKSEQLLIDLLKKEGRIIQNNQKEIFLAQYEAIQSPLYIHIVAQEIKNWKSFESKQTLANTQQDAIKEFIENLTQIYHHDVRFVQKVFLYITASDDGLSEDEIIDLLSIDIEFVKEMAPETYHKNETGEFPLVVWTRLYTQLKPFLGIKKEQGKDILYLFHREFESIVTDSVYQKQEHEAIIVVIQKLIKKYQNEAFDSNRWGKLYATIIVGYDLIYADENKQVEYAEFIANDLNNEVWIEIFINLLNRNGKTNIDYNRTKKSISYISNSKIITHILYQKNPDRWTDYYTFCLGQLAYSLKSIGKTAEVIELEQKALEIREILYKESPDRWAENYTISLNNLATSLESIGKTAEAIDLLQKSLEIRESLYKESPDRWAENYTISLNNLATSLESIGKTAEVMEYRKKSLKITESLYKENPDFWAGNYVVCLNNLAVSLDSVGKNTEAIQLKRKALEITESLYKENPDRWAGNYASSINNLVNSLERVVKNTKAIELGQKSLEITESLYKENPDRWAGIYTMSINNLAVSLESVGKNTEAIQLERKALKITESLYKENPDRWAGIYTMSINNLVNSLERVVKNTEAIELGQKSLEITESLYKENPDRWAENYTASLFSLAFSLKNVGKNTEAIELGQKSLEITESLYKENPDRWAGIYISALNILAYPLRNIGKNTEAIELGKKSLKITESLYKENPDRWADYYTRNLDNLATSLENIGKTTEVIELEQKSLEITESLYKESPDRRADYYTKRLNSLALSLGNIGRNTEAIELNEKALAIKNTTNINN